MISDHMPYDQKKQSVNSKGYRRFGDILYPTDTLELQLFVFA